jgi:hypothetical protein
MEPTMLLLIDGEGSVRCLYGEAFELSADLSPVGGTKLGPFDRRSEALDAERVWLEKCLLGGARKGSLSR